MNTSKSFDSTSNDRTCFLHIGTHKTGTTSIQKFCDKYRNILREYNFLYPFANQFAHHNIAWELRGDPRYVKDSGDLQSLISEAKIAGFPHLIISSEDFEYLTNNSSARETLLHTLRDAGYNIHLIVALREQASYAISLYNELIKHGLKQSFNKMIEEILSKGYFCCHKDWFFNFDYKQLIEVWNQSNVSVISAIPYVPKVNIITKFLEVLGFDKKEKLIIAANNTERYNISPSKEAKLQKKENNQHCCFQIEQRFYNSNQWVKKTYRCNFINHYSTNFHFHLIIRHIKNILNVKKR